MLKKILHIILLLTNAVFALSLILAYLSVYISPEICWVPAFFGLAYPALIIVNFLFAIYWAFRRRIKLLIFTGLIIIVGVSYITDYFQIRFNSNTENNENADIKIMSYNVKLFNLYNWKNNKTIRNEIFDIIKEEQADIICFQEFYKESSKRFNTLDTLKEFQDAKYYHEEYTQINRKKHFFGIATFSKYPIINTGKFVFENSDNICIYSDVVINEDTIRIYNNHLESIRFDYTDYNFIDSIEFKFDNKRIEGAKTITKRLKNAFIKRANQVDIISENIEQCPYPVVVCGDFNDTPISYAYHKMKMGLIDAFKESGSGIGKTYTGKFPSFRIDYLFYSQEMKSISFKIINKEHSDHYPIVCNLEFTK